MNGIVEHPLWPRIASYFQIQEYRRDGGAGNCRFRIEVKDMPPALRQEALAMTAHCVACGGTIHPIRVRRAPSHIAAGALYFACACPLQVSVGCSRGSAAKAEYLRVREAKRQIDEGRR